MGALENYQATSTQGKHWQLEKYLNQQWVSKTQSTLQVLPKGIIQEAGSCDLAVFVLIHDELCGLA